MCLLSWTGGDPHASMKAVVGEYELPNFPVVTLRALELIRNDDTSLDEIGRQCPLIQRLRFDCWRR